MADVFVWFPGDPKVHRFFHLISGHVAVQASGNYYSFWPGRGKKLERNLGLTKAAPADFEKVSYAVDRDGMGYERDVAVSINGLNEQAMRTEWNRIKSNATHYQLFNTNCCTVSGRLLNVGLVNTEKWRTTWEPRAGRWLRTCLDMTTGASLNPKSDVKTVTPSVTLYFALLVKNAVEGYEETEDEVYRRVKAEQSKAMPWQQYTGGLTGAIARLIGFFS